MWVRPLPWWLLLLPLYLVGGERHFRAFHLFFFVLMLVWDDHGRGGIFIVDRQGEGGSDQGEHCGGDEGCMIGCKVWDDDSLAVAGDDSDDAEYGAQDGYS
jgi:hypothetical protein